MGSVAHLPHDVPACRGEAASRPRARRHIALRMPLGSHEIVACMLQEAQDVGIGPTIGAPNPFDQYPVDLAMGCLSVGVELVHVVEKRDGVCVPNSDLVKKTKLAT